MIRSVNRHGSSKSKFASRNHASCMVSRLRFWNVAPAFQGGHPQLCCMFYESRRDSSNRLIYCRSVFPRRTPAALLRGLTSLGETRLRYFLYFRLSRWGESARWPGGKWSRNWGIVCSSESSDKPSESVPSCSISSRSILVTESSFFERPDPDRAWKPVLI